LRVSTKGLSSTKDPIIDYATVYWAVHQERASGADSETRDLLSAFLFEEDHFDNWLDSLDSLQISTRLGYLNGDLIIRLQAARSTPTSPTFAVASFGLVEALETNRRDDWTVEWDKLNDEGAPPLYLAARWGHLDTVEYMIDRGADVNISGGRYDTALQVAAYFGHTKIVSMLLDNGAVAFGSGNGPFPNVVHAAIAGNCPSIAKHILDQGFEFPDQSSYDACYSIAAFSGQVSTVQLLLDIFAGKYTPQTVHDPLQVALYGRKERKAKALLAGYGDINQQIGYFGNALQAAICGGKLSLVETLTDYRADLGLRGRYGYPLRVAAAFGHRDIVQWLLTEQNANPNVKDEELGDCLQAAAVNGHAEIVALLLQHGAKIEGSGGASRWQIKAASALGHLRIAQILFKNGAYIHQNEFLMAAILARQDDAVRFLIDKGAKVNFDSIQAKTSFTRVGFGEESNRVGSREEITHVSAFSALAALEPQENEEIEDNRETRWDPEIRRLPLPEIKELHDFDYDLFESGPLIAATLRRNLILVSLLLSAGARIDAGGENTFTALQAAAHYGYREIVDRLLDAGANPNRCCNVFGSALHAALDGSQFEIATLLLKRGANIHQHWYGFGSCLQIYSERGDLSVVRYLLDQGADINDRGGQNGTALQVAASTGRLEVVRLLVEHGAELNAPGGDLGTALQAAADTDHFEIAQYLSSQGARTTLSPALQIGVDCL
jgi:ankyrin repeat protein